MTIIGLQELAASYGRHGPVVPLGEGMDFATYTCDDLVLRVPKRAEVARLVDGEYQLLMALPDDFALAVPRPLGPPVVPSGGRHPALVYPLLQGTPLCDVTTSVDFAGLGASLGRFLKGLHEAAPREVNPGIEFAAWAEAARRQLPRMADLLDAELVDAARTALGQTLPPIGPERVMCHRDLTDDHVLVDANGAACGVIDFGDAGPSPWWHDLVGIWMWGGDVALAASCRAYGRELDGDERRLLEYHAVTVAVGDAFHASQHLNAAELVPKEIAILRRVLRP